jgi:hypothetical protein
MRLRNTSRGEASSSKWKMTTTLAVLSLLPTTLAYTTNPMFDKYASPRRSVPRWGPPVKRDEGKPLIVTNRCEQTIWPGIGTQAGTGPGTGGFELKADDRRELKVSADWQGRVWGRTNCSFNVDGTGASNLNGHDGSGRACKTGDCAGVLDCVLTVSLCTCYIWIDTDIVQGGNTCHACRVHT